MCSSQGLRGFPTALACGALICAALAGCSLERYFQDADEEAKCLIAETSNDPRWAMPSFRVQPDPRSRYYDPYNHVRPPMPEDDPASHRFMECVDGMKGWPCWGQNGYRRFLNNPDWRSRLPEYVDLTPDGAVKLSLDSAVQLALVNSPTFQTQLEEVYLSALDVSTERFRFDVQFFGGNATSFDHLGRLRPGGESNTLRTDTDFQLRRQFATAGELVVEFANSFVWQFAGPDTNLALSTLSFALTQPLLRGAGRDVALEQLTITERTLLANLRAMAQYREGFFTQIAIGELGVSGPQRRGGFFGGTGLTGFTGTGSGGFGGVGEATGFGRGGISTGGGGAAGGTTGFVGGGAGQVGGFIGLLQQLQQIRNTRESLNLELRTLPLLVAFWEAEKIELTQVDQFRQSVETERANLLQATNSLEGSLDSFKTGTLGLPPDLEIDLQDNLIRQFQLIDPQTSAIQNRIAAFTLEFGQRPPEPDVQTLRTTIAALADLRNAAIREFDRVDKDLHRLDANLEERTRGMPPEEQDQLGKDIQKLGQSFAELKKRFDATEAELQQLSKGLTPDTRHATDFRLIEVSTEIRQIVDELTLVQARARLEQVWVEPVALDPPVALEIARANRLDWMNNRAALVDTWRLIQFNADRLESDLEVVFSGDLKTARDNPLSFRAPMGSLSAGLRFDAPFTRLQERNTFRQQLINYEQDRRQLIRYEDGIYQTLRSLLRNLKQLEVNLEIQRRAVIIAITRVDQTREVLNKPPEAEDTQLGPTAALDLLYALSDLRSAQNNFMSVWLNHYATRMSLMRSLGVMQIDQHGMWVDVPLDQLLATPPEQVPLPPPVPGQLLQLLEIGPSQETASSAEPALNEAQLTGPPVAPGPDDSP